MENLKVLAGMCSLKGTMTSWTDDVTSGCFRFWQDPIRQIFPPLGLRGCCNDRLNQSYNFEQGRQFAL